MKKILSLILALLIVFSVSTILFVGCTPTPPAIDDSGVPETPETPETPEIPETPETPNTPDEPETPVIPPEQEKRRVLLVSIDGLRPDALVNTELGKRLVGMSSYSLNTRTIYPSLTLPAHMSMFHSVSPATHGITTNNYTPSASLGNGITETLTNAGKTVAMFYDWDKIANLTTVSDTQKLTKTYIPGGNPTAGMEQYEASATALTNACIEHIKTTPTDLTLLYFGLTDEMGEEYKWLSDKYYWSIDHVLSNLFRVIEVLSDDYVVIITSDHGGGGKASNAHGSDKDVDMTIPLLLIGKDYECGRAIPFATSILDVTPTVADIVGISGEEYWVGESVAKRLSESEAVVPDSTSQSTALGIFTSRDSWGDLHHGKITSFDKIDGGIKIGATDNGSTKFVGFKLKKDAVLKLISLGYRYVSFTVEISVDSGTLPKYVDMYIYPYHDDFIISTPDTKDPDYPEEQYYLSGREIVLDLEALYTSLANDTGLNFIFIENGIWTPTGDAYLSFKNISFSTGLR